MTREEIEQINVVKPYCFETDREEQWYQVGLQEGLEVADKHPQSPWISVKDDLPYNHEELMTDWGKRSTDHVFSSVHGLIILNRMDRSEGEWHWIKGEPTHWMPIPKLPKE